MSRTYTRVKIPKHAAIQQLMSQGCSYCRLSDIEHIVAADQHLAQVAGKVAVHKLLSVAQLLVHVSVGREENACEF